MEFKAISLISGRDYFLNLLTRRGEKREKILEKVANDFHFIPFLEGEEKRIPLF
jgi:hypothetical protein